MGNRKIAGALALLLMFVLVWQAIYWQRSRQQPTPETLLSVGRLLDGQTALQGLNTDFTLDAAAFRSSFPLVVIEAQREQLGAPEKGQPAEKVPAAYMRIISNDDAPNTLNDSARWESHIQIGRRGNSSLYFEKGQYGLRLVDDQGQKRNLDLFSMGKDDGWILSGSMIDKSLMRNYLAYTLAGEMMNYAPATQYCEVIFLEEDGQYRYEGVYLLVQRIGRGEDRVPIQQTKPGDLYTDFILRRDRSGKEDVTLDTYGSRNALTYPEGQEDNYGHLGVVYPSARLLNEASTQYIEESINRLEETLYSDDPVRFFQYTRYIDVSSFVDYALLNELLFNYDAGYHSTYFYRPKSGKIYAGPVWDFDQAMDNYRPSPSDPDGFYFFHAPWFDRLVLDYEYVQKLESRFQTLRRSVFSDAHIEKIIDITAASLDAAQRRDWTRWAHQYEETTSSYALAPHVDADGDQLARHAASYQEEIAKLKRSIREHAHSMDIHMKKDLEKACIDGSKRLVPSKLLLAIASLLAFFVSIILVRRMA